MAGDPAGFQDAAGIIGGGVTAGRWKNAVRGSLRLRAGPFY
jgi:hypothetical protein